MTKPEELPLKGSDFSSAPDVSQKVSGVGSAARTIETAADFERAIGAAERNEPSPGVPSRVHAA